MKDVGTWSYVGLLLLCSSVCVGVYLIADYYMDDSWPTAFGQACGDSIEDDCLYVNSHLNFLGIKDYGDDISCLIQLDAGNRHGARYKLKFKTFDLEYTESCAYDSLTIYDTAQANVTFTHPIGKFCGKTEPNLTGFPTQQYLTLKFQTDDSTGDEGYRILATRTLPYPCSDDYFHCKSENRCIDGRLRCDGTVQCDDETDEDNCSFWEKVLGGFMALGLSGIVGITFLCVSVCTGICVTVCICTCCRKRCDCLFKCCNKCCNKCCGSCRTRVHKLRSTIGVWQGDDDTRMGVVNTDKEMIINDETANKPSVASGDGNVTSGVNVATKTTFAGGVTADCNPLPKTATLSVTQLQSDCTLEVKAPLLTSNEITSGVHVVQVGVASKLNDNSVTKID